MKYIVRTKKGIVYTVDCSNSITLDETGLHIEDSDGVITTIYARAIEEIVPVGRAILESAKDAVDV